MAAACRVNVFWSDEDEACTTFRTSAIALPWVTLPTKPSPRSSSAIEAWLEAARSTGRPIPPPSARAAHA
jgi:hypothetical protein